MSSSATMLYFILVVLLLQPGTVVPNSPSLNQILEENNFPFDILPKDIKSFTLNKDTGEFRVNIGEACQFPMNGFDFMFKPPITGVISKGNLTNLKGVKVKRMFFWGNVVEVTRPNDESINFSLGKGVGEDDDVGSFNKLPQCGCGLRCKGLKFMKAFNQQLGFVFVLLFCWALFIYHLVKTL